MGAVAGFENDISPTFRGECDEPFEDIDKLEFQIMAMPAGDAVCRPRDLNMIRPHAPLGGIAYAKIAIAHEGPKALLMPRGRRNLVE